jgi:hypothetical protein
MGTLVHMTGFSAAELERAVAQMGVHNRLVELVVHGKSEWTVLIAGRLYAVEEAAGLDASGNIVVSFLLPRAPEDFDAYHLHADGVHIQTEAGKITKDRACRLRITFPIQADRNVTAPT